MQAGKENSDQKPIVEHHQPIVGTKRFTLEPYLFIIPSNINTFNIKL